MECHIFVVISADYRTNHFCNFRDSRSERERGFFVKERKEKRRKEWKKEEMKEKGKEGEGEGIDN